MLWVWGKGDKGQVSMCCGYGVRGQGTGECVLWVWGKGTRDR